MIIEAIWLIKLLIAHLITDFILQPRSWVEDRNQKHFLSSRLYMHALITGLVAWAFMGWHYWLVALIITTTHFLIDGWKSYRQQNVSFFLIDQLLHGIIIAGCWFFCFVKLSDVEQTVNTINKSIAVWKILAAVIFVTTPAGILIGQLTKQWRDKIEHAASLENAGKWIGIIERLIILVFVLQNQYSAIGLLVAAKGIIRFNEKDRPEIKTEYLVIGTLMSIIIALATGLLVKL